jgi:hypothetical protein
MTGIKHSSGSLPAEPNPARPDAHDAAAELPAPSDGWEG